MDFFNVEGGGLPVMEVDPAASDDDRLVFVRGPRRSCGVVIGMLGLAALAGAVAGAVSSGEPRERSALLALGAFAAVAGSALGVALASSRYRLIVDRREGRLVSSWWFLGLENRTSKAIGEPRSVGWAREVEQSGGGTGPATERIRFPVLLHYRVGGRGGMQRLFVASDEEVARRLARALAEFLGVDPGDRGQ
ncbi:hypothetical protein [Tautonia plasticadhaerens]|uniref:Uncharacterized protein n=1 Tax=Tautonia plasticadhaerens TaxID=2527974 RepID=A0A518GW74_9BACT|nr:hypothetical protein [Tautonia plasticadhaerens]QDV32846.1 hypothetical protein ElP_06860 [Tautonia plasticadhaerens]